MTEIIKATPGPWVWQNEEECLVGPDQIVMRQDEGGMSFAHYQDGMTEANRALIAAAPELLSTMASIVSMMGNVDHSRGGGENTARLYGGMLESIRELANFAIAKAVGQP